MSGVSENKPPLNCVLAGSSIPIVLQHFPWAGKGSGGRGAIAEDDVAPLRAPVSPVIAHSRCFFFFFLKNL